MTIFFVLCCLLLAPPAVPPAKSAEGHEYPLRPFYPAVRTIDTKEFLRLYFGSIIIDVRNRFEFDFIHINKAKHIPLSGRDLLVSIARLRAKHSPTPLIFYCNDPSCAAAFQAAVQVLNAGFSNVFVYDTGVFPLLKTAPELITLMATTPAQPDLVIPAGYADRVRVDYKDFKERASGINSVVVDIRDIYNRLYEPRLEGIQNIPMESFLAAVSNRVWLEKDLLIFDEDGKKIHWLQYFLQANGYTDYIFLRGGVKGLDRDTQLRKITRPDAWVNLDQQRLTTLTTDSSLHPLDIRVMNLLTASISFENHALIAHGRLPEFLACTEQEFIASLNRLRRAGCLLYSDSGKMLTVHLDPRLAWKGSVSGEVRADRVREFEASLQLLPDSAR